MDKAQKYTDKALAQIDKIPSTSDDRRKLPPSMLSSFHVILLEHVIQCRIVSGNKSRAIKVTVFLKRKRNRVLILSIIKHENDKNFLSFFTSNFVWFKSQINKFLLKELGNLCCLLEKSPPLLQRHRAQLHTLLGLYAMSMNCMDAAESQLNAALRVNSYYLLKNEDFQ